MKLNSACSKSCAVRSGFDQRLYVMGASKGVPPTCFLDAEAEGCLAYCFKHGYHQRRHLHSLAAFSTVDCGNLFGWVPTGQFTRVLD